jgi:hypothetical protein
MHLGLRTIGIPLLPARVSSQAALTRCLAALGGLAVAHLRSAVAVKPFQPLASFFRKRIASCSFGCAIQLRYFNSCHHFIPVLTQRPWSSTIHLLCSRRVFLRADYRVRHPVFLRVGPK